MRMKRKQDAELINELRKFVFTGGQKHGGRAGRASMASSLSPCRVAAGGSGRSSSSSSSGGTKREDDLNAPTVEEGEGETDVSPSG